MKIILVFLRHCSLISLHKSAVTQDKSWQLFKNAVTTQKNLHSVQRPLFPLLKSFKNILNSNWASILWTAAFFLQQHKFVFHIERDNNSIFYYTSFLTLALEFPFPVFHPRRKIRFEEIKNWNKNFFLRLLLRVVIFFSGKEIESKGE